MLTQAWGTVRKRPWWPVAGTLLGLFAGLFAAHREVNVYQASARIIISRATVGKLRLTSTDEVGAPAAIGNQMLEMKSDAVLNQVTRDLNLVNDPAVPVTRSAGHGDSSYRRAWLRELKLGVSVRVVPTTSIVVVSFSSRARASLLRWSTRWSTTLSGRATSKASSAAGAPPSGRPTSLPS